MYNAIPSRHGISNSTNIDNDFARIRPFIPERTSSNPQQISKFVNALNYDVSSIPRIRPAISHDLLNGRYTPTSTTTMGTTVAATMTANPIPYNSNNPTISVGPVSAAPVPSKSSSNGILNGGSPNERLRSPVSPRAYSADAKKNEWRITGKRVQQFQVCTIYATICRTAR